MEIRVLKYFLAVADEHGYNAAARSLNVTQPTISRQISELENELGVTLFERGRRGRKLELTEDGEVLYRKAREICTLADRTEQTFKSAHEDISGNVSIGGGETRGMSILTDAAVKLMQAHPSITFDMFSGNADDVCARLDSGLIDFGLLLGTEGPERYERLSLPIFDTWGLLMRKDDAMAEKRSIAPSDIEGLPLIMSSQRTCKGMFSGWLGGDADALNVVGTYNLLYNASLMVESGLGYAFCIDGIIDVGRDSAFAFKPFSPTLRNNMHLVWKRDATLPTAAREYLSILKDMAWVDRDAS